MSDPMSTHAPVPTAGPGGPSRLLAACAHDLAESADLAASAQATLEHVAHYLAAEAGTLFLALDDSLPSRLADTCARAPMGERLRPGAGPAGRCFASRRLIAVRQATTVVAVPITVGQRCLGVLELRGRPGPDFGADTIELLWAVASLLALAVSRARLAQSLAERSRVDGDLDLVAEIQRNLLPRVDPAHSPVYALNLPARRVSGDFFDFFALPDGAIAFALGDVSGKGIKAALLMAKTASLFRCLGKRDPDPAVLLREINREICETASHGMFVTMVAGLYQPRSGDLGFANAGHQPPLLRLPDRSYRSYPAEAPPLGVLAELDFTTQGVNLAGGEFYVFSDGLTEYRYGRDEELGVDGLVQMIEALAAEPFAERLRILLAQLDQAGWEVRDDLTVLAIDDAWSPPREEVAP